MPLGSIHILKYSYIRSGSPNVYLPNKGIAEIARTVVCHFKFSLFMSESLNRSLNRLFDSGTNECCSERSRWFCCGFVWNRFRWRSEPIRNNWQILLLKCKLIILTSCLFKCYLLFKSTTTAVFLRISNRPRLALLNLLH